MAADSTSPAAVRDGILGHSWRQRLRQRLKATSSALSTGSPTSTTTSMTRSATAFWPPLSCRAADRESLVRAGHERIDTLVHDLVEHSSRVGAIVQSEVVGAAMSELRDFMFARCLPRP